MYPLLGKSVFMQVLHDLHIQCIQTQFEADQVNKYKYYHLRIFIRSVFTNIKHKCNGQMTLIECQRPVLQLAISRQNHDKSET